MDFSNLGEVINKEIKEASKGDGVHFVMPEKIKPDKIQEGEYFIILTKMFSYHGYQIWKDNHIHSYEWCHLESREGARVKALLSIYLKMEEVEDEIVDSEKAYKKD